MPDTPTPLTPGETRSLFRTALGVGAPGLAWQPPEPAALAPFFPGYGIEALIARGGMGAVYRARQLSLNRTVAIKLLPFDLGVQEDFALRSKREAEALALLSHPHIVAVHDFGQADDGHHFMVMEFVEGSDLATRLRTHGPLPPPEALRIVREVCDALHYAHERGLVHRDIKPGNVLLDAAGRVKVSDFGLAKIIAPVPAIGPAATGIVGTPDYMAPEQLTAPGQVDRRADIYSVGVMLYELLTGHLPRGVFPPVSTLVPTARGLDGVVARALQSDPGRRYGSVIELSTELALSSAARRPRVLWWSLAVLVAAAAAALLLRPAVPPAVKPAPFENSLGLRFLPAGTPGVLFCTTETRVRDFDTYWRATSAARLGVVAKSPVYYNHDGTTQGWATRPASWREPGFPQTPDDPVVAISQIEANDFCAWLTLHERTAGRIAPHARYRLPTDAEWSVAAGIDAAAHDPSGAYPWHGDFPPPAQAGNFAGEELREDPAFAQMPIISGHRDAHRCTGPVGTYPPNKNGLHDMGGNASEWVQSSQASGATIRGSNWWNSQADTLDSGYRRSVGKDVRSFILGFRIVLEKQP